MVIDGVTMTAWMAWHFRRTFWEVGVWKDGRRVVLFHKRRQSQAQGLILLGLVSELSWQEISAWLNLEPEELWASDTAADGPAAGPARGAAGLPP